MLSEITFSDETANPVGAAADTLKELKAAQYRRLPRPVLANQQYGVVAEKIEREVLKTAEVVDV